MAYQILDPGQLKFYKPTQYHKEGTAILLNEGVSPIEGTTKTVGNANPDSLKGTLPAETTPTNELPNPSASTDQLTALRITMRNMSRLASKQGLTSGIQALAGGMEKAGMGPSQMPGSTVKGIIDFVEQQTNRPIQDEFANMLDTINAIGTRQKELADEAYQTSIKANSMIESSITSGAWQKMAPDQRQKLWEAAGFTGPAIVSDQKKLAFSQVEDDAGHVWQIAYDSDTGDVVRKTDLGKIGKATKQAAGASALDIQQQTLQIQKMMQELNNPELDPKSAVKDMATQLSTVAGTDGFVSPDDYQKAKTAWVQKTGLTAKEFDDSFSNYRNPVNPYYNVTK